MRILLLIFTVLAMPLAAQELPAVFKVTGVASDDVLNVRENPRASSALVGSFASDAADIEVVAVSENSNWGHVSVGEQNGWVSMTFLEETAPLTGTETHMDRPLYCAGTEPFWGLNILPDTGVQFEGKALTLDYAGSAVNRMPLRMAFTGSAENLNLTGVLRREECSDGMSDRVFGLSLDLVVQDGDTTSLMLGCCSLVAPN